MKVKVYCPCGAKFEFEVEPVNERMPVPINCPVCGADSTALANEVIRWQLAAPQPVAAPEQAPPPTPAPPSSGLRIARAAVVTASDESAQPSRPVVARAVPQRPAPAAAPAWKKNLSQDELNPVTKRIVGAVLVLLAIAGAAWFWYTWFGRDPKLVYSLDFPKFTSASGRDMYRSDAFYDLIAPNRLIAIKNQHVTLMDVSQQISLWSVPVPAGEEDSYGSPHVVEASNDVWVAWPASLMRIDRQTGAQKQLSLPDHVVHVTLGHDMALVVSSDPSAGQTVTQFSLADGSSQTAEITASPQSNAPAISMTNAAVAQSPVNSTPTAGETARYGTKLRLKMLSLGASGNVPQDDPAFSSFEEGPSPVFDAGPNAVWVQNQLLEHRVVMRDAMKKAPTKSVLDNPNVTASQGLDYAEEMLNSAQRERTGGVDYVDVSRYQVTLHRLFAQGVPDWTGEIIGPPRFIPLKTVDLIVANTNLVVFDKNNKKLWDTKLTYPASSSGSFEDDDPPCLETKDALYFADKGMLTRFDLATGNVRWRLTSVGISAVQADDRGRLYVDTTTMQAGAIQYSQQINVRERDLRVIMQVDPATANILWRSDFPGSSYQCLISGKFVYSARVWQTQDPLKFEEGPDTHFTFKLLESSNGKMVWNHVLDNKQLIKVQVQKNWFLLQFADQVAVFKFFSL